MAIGIGVTPIADSEEEPLTSSPAAVSDAAVDKLPAPAVQDAQAVACPREEAAEHSANAASGCTDVLDVDQSKPSTDAATTHIDQPDLQSIHETATNSNSACAVETPLQADTSPQASGHAADAHQQDMRPATGRSDGEADSLGDAGTSPEARRAPGLGEPATLQMDQQSRPQNDHSQPQLREYASNIFDCNSVQQDDPSNQYPQNEAVGSHSMVLSPTHGDPVRPASSEQGLIRAGDVSVIFQRDAAAAEIKSLAARLGHGIIHEAAINTSSSASTDPSEDRVTAGQTAPDTIDAPKSMELNTLPNALNLSSSGVAPGEHKIASESSAPHHAPIPTSGEESQHATKSAAAYSTPALGLGHAATRNDHEASDRTPFAPGSTATGSMADGHNIPSHQHQHDNTPNAIATNDSSKAKATPSHHSTTASNEQRREADHHVTESAKDVAAGPPSENMAQNASGTVQLGGYDGFTTVDNQDVASKAARVQTESQSTASQASEPTPPRPAVTLSPQEITLVELRAQKAALLSSLRVQPAIQVVMEENQTLDVDMSDDDGEPTETEIMAAANKIVKDHIKLLHEYNELKDVGQGLMGLIADQRGLRIIEVQDEFGIDTND